MPAPSRNLLGRNWSGRLQRKRAQQAGSKRHTARFKAVHRGVNARAPTSGLRWGAGVGGEGVLTCIGWFPPWPSRCSRRCHWRCVASDAVSRQQAVMPHGWNLPHCDVVQEQPHTRCHCPCQLPHPAPAPRVPVPSCPGLAAEQKPMPRRCPMGLVSRLRRALVPRGQGAGRRRWPRDPAEESLVRGVVRSMGGFLLGMALASLYGAMVLLAQSYSIWYCLASTVSLGAGLGLGMAFSSKVRLTVLLGLPHVFSSKHHNALHPAPVTHGVGLMLQNCPGKHVGQPLPQPAVSPAWLWHCTLHPLLPSRGLWAWHGPGPTPAFHSPGTSHPCSAEEAKGLLLVLAMGMAMQGPCANIVRNFTRASEAVSCGAELALNQTAEMLQRAQEPLLSALNKIKAIAQKAKVVGDRVRKFFHSVMDSVRHVARILRNVWRWLLGMGELCNQELGTPYRRCLRVFDDAKDRCERAIPTLYFLCYIVLVFKPLCGVANLLLVFCIIPWYIQPFLRKRVAAPVLKVLNRVRQEFEFNISAVHQFDVSLNATRSLAEVARDLMEAVSQRLQPARELLGFFAHASVCVGLYLYLQLHVPPASRALWYRHRYLRNDTFDNIYITQRFVVMDMLRAQQGRPTILPLTARESTKYIHPGSLILSRRERRGYGLALIRVLRHVLLGLSLILLDYGVFWLLDLLRHQLQGEVIARAPVLASIEVKGSGYASEIYRNLVSAFDVLQRGNISVLSRRCRLRPAEPNYQTYRFIGLLYGVCCFTAVFGSYVGRVRRALCAWYYPSREQERTCFLYNNILTRREGLARALCRAVRQRVADGGHTHPLLILASRLRPCAWLVRMLGIHQQYCLGCGCSTQPGTQPDLIACMTPGCRGVYCQECHQALNNICSICMAPLGYQGDGNEEIDSSDEETVRLWLGAARALRGQQQEQRHRLRQLLRHRIQCWLQGRRAGRRLPREVAQWAQAQLEEDRSGGSEDGSSSPGAAKEGSFSSSSDSSLDFSYQDHSEGSDGSAGSMPSPGTPKHSVPEMPAALKEAAPGPDP
ncbi:PREDICTED: LOW QUALITY PROTEIN: DC-STAMP domain-containing protein 2 [Crocodylus porosus]|uniref:LOW QUALITY PROTEIN: DC-STAMP domain-containing protein 2 n=1 Tax=Crocodylus porosus TaxID=8502 RepID=UPI00093D80FA|nr:PREDICTED: LOW QUALITY PROTEIN: DC-STAMP domain-containing protein 2 [Crocodylus porosus]